MEHNLHRSMMDKMVAAGVAWYKKNPSKNIPVGEGLHELRSAMAQAVDGQCSVYMVAAASVLVLQELAKS